MVVDGQNMHDDQTSDCRSFGSNYHPSSQSRKISIGIMIDSLSLNKKITGSRKEDKTGAENAEMLNSNNKSIKEANNKGSGVEVAIKATETQCPEQVRSAWNIARSYDQNEGMPKAVFSTNQTSNSPGIRERQKKPNGMKYAPKTYSVEVLANQTIVESCDDKQKRFDGVIYKRKEGKDGLPKSIKEFTFAAAAAQEVFVQSKAVTEVKEDKTKKVVKTDEAVITDETENTNKAHKSEHRSTETLRTKLQEILGTVSSPNSQDMISQAHEVGVSKCKLDQVADKKGDALVKPRQSSDTIETDSENSDHAIRRPVTRSLTRKRTPTKLQKRKTNFVSSSTYKQKHQEKNIFSFEEGWPGKLNNTVRENCISTVYERKKPMRKSCVIEPRKIFFCDENDTEKTLKENYRRETQRPTMKNYSFGNKMGNLNHPSHGKKGDVQEPETTTLKKDYDQLSNKTNKLDDFYRPTFPEKGDAEKTQRKSYGGETQPSAMKKYCFGSTMRAFNHPTPQEKSDFQEPQNATLEKDNHQSLDKTNQMDHFDSPILPENRDHQESSDNPSNKNSLEPKDDLQIPTIGIKIPAVAPSPASTPEIVQMEESDSSLVREKKKFIVKNVHNFRNLEALKTTCCRPNAQKDASDYSGKLNDYLAKKETPFKLRKTVAQDLSASSSDERDSDSSEEDTPTIKGYQCRRDRDTSLENSSAEKLNFMLRPTKRVHDAEATNVKELSPTSPSLNGLSIQNTDFFHEPPEQNQEDGLGRAVTLFAKALSNFEVKLKSAARKKSSEILMSVSDGIHVRLQDVENQIQTDVGKLTSLSKLKRKRLETRFQEQEERLRVIHEKFKEEVHYFLQDCGSTVEGLETQHSELKGTVKKQKASHQKLILHMEETIGTELTNAQRRISAVNESAKEKIFQLKRLVAECLKEDILS